MTTCPGAPARSHTRQAHADPPSCTGAIHGRGCPNPERPRGLGTLAVS
jgi:hypothetical protein